MSDTQIVTSHDELVKFVKDGHFFMFCVAFALNKGFKNVIEEKKNMDFMVGDYKVTFKPDEMAFYLNHKIYFARMIQAYYGGAHFVIKIKSHFIWFECNFI